MARHLNSPQRNKASACVHLPTGTPMKTALRLASALLLSTSAVPALAQEKVTIAVGTSVLNVGYPMLTLPMTLGYWKDAGFDVSVEPVGASLQAIQQMVAGNADFAQVDASVVVQANVENDLPVRIAMGNNVIDWSISVPTDSDIRGAADLKGKTIGVFSLATGGIPYLESYLAEAGMDMENDIELIPVGFGAAPVEAFKSGQVDALLYWGSATAGFENAGLEINKIAPEDWRRYPGYSLTTMQGTAERAPEMVTAIIKGAAMASVFAEANPECAVRLHWKAFPETRPAGVPEETALEHDLNYLNAQLGSMTDAFALNGGELWGAVDTEGFGRLQSFLNAAGIVEGDIPPEDYIVAIPGFFETINDFDADAVRAAANACDML
ncbi:ABC transporter substrate-binding protein [Meridianimarinicoccus zhengii]|uniref:ABC transporter substrate-binding protein n=1 Tax=Meridianimarinicoccus zhengii TaxID=2056810 RepID=UPI0013A6B47D|nr:ABC transporter substrate-binding protein [Phycocomes zhengii]